MTIAFDLVELTELSLAAAAGEEDWTAVCASTVAQLDLDSFVIDIRDVSGGEASISETLGMEGLPDDVPALYNAYYGRADPVKPHVLRSAPGVALQPTQLIPRAALERTEYWNDFALPFGMINIISSWEHVGPGLVLACGGTRSGGAPLTRSEERSLDAFFSLLGRAARLHLLRRQERDRGDLLARALSALDHAVLLVDERAHITEANRAGRRMLDRGDGLLSVRGVVAARDARAQGELRAMIRHAAATHTTASLVIPKQTPGTHLLVDVIGGPWGTRARCLVLIRDPAAKRSRFDLAMRLYGLTPAEARVADALTEGRSPREIADDFGVAPGTVKNQLKQVFAKVGVRRQAELVSVLAPLTDLRGDPEER